MEKTKILIVEDEGIIADDIANVLRKKNYEIIGICPSGKKALEAIEKKIPDLVLMDIMIKGDIDGVQTADLIKERIDAPVIYLTAFPDDNTIQRAKITDPFGYILKPFEERELYTNIEMALYKHKAVVETKNRQRILEILTNFDEVVSKLSSFLVVSKSVNFINNYLNIGLPLAYIYNKKNSEYQIYCPEGMENVIESDKALRKDTMMSEFQSVKSFFLSDNLSMYSKYKFEKRLIDKKYKSAALFPLELENEQIGFFALFSKSGETITEKDRNLLSLLITRLQSALYNARLYESLQESRSRLKTFSDSLPQIVCEIDLNGRLLYVNNIALEIFGYNKDEIDDFNVFDQIATEDKDKLYENLKRIILGEDVKGVEYTALKKNGERFPVIIYGNVNFQNGAPVGFRAILIDISERKKNEETIRKLSMAVEQSASSIIITDSHGNIEYVNPQFSKVSGYSGKEAIGRNPNLLKSGKMQSSEYKKLWDTINNGGEWRGEFLNKKKNGELYWELATISPIRDSNKVTTHFIAVKEDITERRKVEDKLAEEKERLAVTLGSIADGVITTDTSGKITLINKAAEKILESDLKDALNEPIEALFNIYEDISRGKVKNPVELVLSSGVSYESAKPVILITKSGKEKIIEDSGSPIKDVSGRIIGVVLVFRDITEKYKMQDDYYKSKKLESIGILAGGIAHDFNNFLTAILGNITLGKIYSSQNDKIYEILSEAEKACIRSKELTQQLLTFSKGGTPVKKIGSISSLLKESIDFILRGSNVKSEYIEKEPPLAIEMDEGQINQVINNLVINAKQSMENGGLLTVKVENIKKKATDNLPIADGNYVKISIKDRGVGISKENLQKIFDPYFSTKKMGNGLGLSISYSIIQKHNGYITAESEMGKGATFYIYLPAIDVVYEKSDGGGAKVLMKSARVLLMDDEDLVREVTGKMLNFIGCEVEFASDGEEAIEIYKEAIENNKKYDLVIMDLTIPGGMGGKETIKVLKALDPSIKAVVSSGYSTDEVMSDFKKYGFKGIIVKPYKIEDLSRVINEIIQ